LWETPWRQRKKKGARRARESPAAGDPAKRFSLKKEALVKGDKKEHRRPKKGRGSVSWEKTNGAHFTQGIIPRGLSTHPVLRARLGGRS